MAWVRPAYRAKHQTPRPIDWEIAAIAAPQHALITTGQLIEAGLSRSSIDRRVRSGRLHPEHRGVYSVGHPILTPRARLMAAVLACGRDSLLSHRAAAHLWGLAYFPGIEEVTLPRTIPGPRGVTVHTSRTIKREQRIVLDAIPITSINRTLVDLADVVHDHRRLARAVHEADIRQALDVVEIYRLMNGRHGARRLKRALAGHRPADLKSGLEFDFHRLVVDAGLPSPQTNVLVEAGDQSLLVDFLWPLQGLIVEVDGPVHQSKRAFETDRERDSLLQLAGYRVIRVTKARIRARRADVLAELSAHLAR